MLNKYSDSDSDSDSECIHLQDKLKYIIALLKPH